MTEDSAPHQRGMPVAEARRVADAPAGVSLAVLRSARVSLGMSSSAQDRERSKAIDEAITTVVSSAVE